MTLTHKNNWVTRRAARERSLRAAAPDLWNNVRAAIQAACKSFRDEYGSTPKRVECGFDDSHRLRVTIFTQKDSIRDDAREDVVIALGADGKGIDVIGGHKTILSLRWYDGAARVVDVNGQRYNPDELSQLILEPLFFGDSHEDGHSRQDVDGTAVESHSWSARRSES
jgi:hypothetical protein